MSAMPGLAIESSTKGVSLSTTTARFIATARVSRTRPDATVRTCADTGAAGITASPRPIRASAIADARVCFDVM